MEDEHLLPVTSKIKGRWIRATPTNSTVWSPISFTSCLHSRREEGHKIHQQDIVPIQGLSTERENWLHPLVPVYLPCISIPERSKLPVSSLCLPPWVSLQMNTWWWWQEAFPCQRRVKNVHFWRSRDWKHHSKPRTASDARWESLKMPLDYSQSCGFTYVSSTASHSNWVFCLLSLEGICLF